MPNVVQCTGCGTNLKTPENAGAGKKIRCPKCRAIVVIPADDVAPDSPGPVAAPRGPGASYPGPVAAPTGPVPAPTGPGSPPAPASSPGPVPAPTRGPAPSPKPAPTPVAAASPERWQVRMTLEGEPQTFGPVTRAELDEWFTENRLDAETQLERNGSGRWIGAASIYPSLAPAPAPAPAPVTPKPAPPTKPAVQKPSAPVASAPSPSPVRPAQATAPVPSQPSMPARPAAPSASPMPVRPAVSLPGAPTPSPPIAPARPAASGFPGIQTGEKGPAPAPGGFPAVGGAPGRVNTGIDPKSASPFPTRKGGKSKIAPVGAAAQDSGEFSSRSKMVAALLAIFLGGLGLQSFYLGFTKRGVIQLAVNICTCGIGGSIWGLVEGIMILTGSLNRDADGRLLR